MIITPGSPNAYPTAARRLDCYLNKALLAIEDRLPKIGGRIKEAITHQHPILRHRTPLLPAIRDTIYHALLPQAEKELLHLEAATLRAQYGQFTAAAYHYAAGGEPQLALRLLYTECESAINQGQAEAALPILQQLSPRRLDAAEQELLALFQAELQKLLGNYDAARQRLAGVYWRIPFLQAQAWRLSGDIAELRGETAVALQAYQAGLATVDQWLVQAADFHRDLGYLYTNDTDFTRAEQEVWRIRHEVANLEGFINEVRGDLVKAALGYREAFGYAQAANYHYGEANTHNNLGRICAWQRDLAQAVTHLDAAQTFFRATGRLNKLASATYNLALAYRLAEAYQAALAPAQEALALFTQLGEEYGLVVACQILAESHLGLGELTAAEAYARQALAKERTGSMPDHLRTLGEIRLKQGSLAEAQSYLQQALTLAQQNGDQLLAAYAWRALGALYGVIGDATQQTAAFQQAATIFQQQNLTAELATIAIAMSEKS